ncbi:MAG: IS200/IS605 family transposase [Lentisphaeraceae bacterium]|nr:IS200/IS605 family transposase [Lentisphaeraceae bacterium]
MPQSLSQVLLHIVFSTKDRKNTIDDSFKKDLYSYIVGICRSNQSNCYRVGGTENHVHLACTLPRTLTISKFVAEVKASSSRWINKNSSLNEKFSWQAGYGVFSLGISQLKSLTSYIDNQDLHHKKRSFQEEFKILLDKYSVDYKEEYLWD